MNTTFEDYEIKKHSWDNLTTLYQGINMRVYKSTWRHEVVCVKHIMFKERSKPTKKEIENEVTILSKCIHPKICQFLGANIDDEDAYMLFEYMEGGDLVKYMRNNELNSQYRLRIMEDVAKGLLYLHHRRPNIIMHRDLKPENILMGVNGIAKIADFGISKLVRKQESMSFHGHTGETGSYTWMSPEILKHENYNYKSDIYSFGLLMYYVWTSRTPFSQYRMNTVQLMYAKFNDELVLEPFETQNEALFQLIMECVQRDPVKRPEMQEVIVCLRNIAEAFSIH